MFEQLALVCNRRPTFFQVIVKAVWSPIDAQFEFPHLPPLRRADSGGRAGSNLPRVPYVRRPEGTD